MNPAQPDSGEMLQRVRQQLILAQVRIMELEDVRDETGARLSETGQLLQAAQTLADQKLDEAAHSENIRADLQAQFGQLQHIQQATQAELAATQARLAAATQHLTLATQAAAELAAQLSQNQEARQTLAAQLSEATARAAAEQQRLAQLNSELRGLQASRSWRWTAGLRSVARRFRGQQP